MTISARHDLSPKIFLLNLKRILSLPFDGEKINQRRCAFVSRLAFLVPLSVPLMPILPLPLSRLGFAVLPLPYSPPPLWLPPLPLPYSPPPLWLPPLPLTLGPLNTLDEGISSLLTNHR